MAEQINNLAGDLNRKTRSLNTALGLVGGVPVKDIPEETILALDERAAVDTEVLANLGRQHLKAHVADVLLRQHR